MSEEIGTLTEGAICVKITLDSRPEFKRRPYVVEIWQYRDSAYDDAVEWRYFRSMRNLNFKSGEPERFKSLEKALEYKNYMLFDEEYAQVEQSLKPQSTCTTTSGLTGSFLK